MLIRHQAKGLVWRVLGLVPSREMPDLEMTHVVLIEMSESKVMPVFMGASKVREALATHQFRVVEDLRTLYDEDRLSVAQRKLLDRRWQLMRSVLPDEEKLFDSSFRGELAEKLATAKIASKPFFYDTLRLYWRGGGGRSSLIPGFARCGQPGVDRIAEDSERARGRPRSISPGKGLSITEVHLRNMRQAWAKAPVGRDGVGLRGAYTWMLSMRYWQHVSVAPGKDQNALVVREEDAVPTFEQFRYYWMKEHAFAERLQKRLKSRAFERLTKLIVTGTLKEVGGPGVRYYIDATVLDIYVVSRLDPNKIIGRPTLYVVVDQFSRMIVGIYIGLEPPCWEGAMLALWNGCLDKVAFCAKYGINITSDLWPTGHIPMHLMGDRGELISYNADRLSTGFNLDVENSRPYAGEAKGVAERYFSTLQAKFGPFMPGYVEKRPERGDEHASLKAALNLEEVMRCMILAVLCMNTRVVRDYEGAAEVVASKTPFVPVKLWAWGVETLRCGYREFPPDYLQAHLWPKHDLKFSRKALHFQRGLYYMSEELAAQTWFVQALVERQRLQAFYHPSNVDVAYLRNIDGTGELIPLTLTRRADRFGGMSLNEVVGLSKAAGENNARAAADLAPLRAEWEMGIHEISNKAKRTAKQLQDPTLSDAARRKGIRQNRQDELDYETSSALIRSVGYDPTGRVLPGEATEPSQEHAEDTHDDFSSLLQERLRNAGLPKD